jgi:hypothetical protein
MMDFLATMTPMQTAWAIYAAGALGCTLAAWWMFLWAWRFIRYTAVLTVLTLLATPYAIDPQTMIMAPAIFSLVFEVMAHGTATVQSVLKVMIGIWLILEVLIILFILLTMRSHQNHPKRAAATYDQPSSRRNASPRTSRSSARGLSRDELDAREELLKGEIPIRAIRD